MSFVEVRGQRLGDLTQHALVPQLVKAGKKVFVYADAYDTIGYTVASAATNICLMEGGEIEIPGVGLETMFYKGIFDKVGVKADSIQIGPHSQLECLGKGRKQRVIPLQKNTVKLLTAWNSELPPGLETPYTRRPPAPTTVNWRT